jgi:hypothetical protein
MHTAEQELREMLSNNQHRFQQEGPHVVRWLTGGTMPDTYATFEQQGDKIIAQCPTCGQAFGRFDANYGTQAYKQIAAIREVGSRHQCYTKL